MYAMRKYAMLALLWTIGPGIYAQNQPQHEKKIYKTPDGKLYIQKELPVYVRLATSPGDNAPSYLLQSEASGKYTNPMYFDMEGYNSLRSPSQVDTVTKKPIFPKQDIVFEIYADSESPLTTAKFNNTDALKTKDKIYLRRKATISFASKDALSGVENIYYSIDSADYQIYSSEITLDTEKQYILKYYSVDHVGNVEDIKQMVLVTDHTSPATTHQLVGNYFENILSSKATITITTNDNNGVGIAKTMYKLDDGNERPYITPINAATLEQGEHKLVYYATDRVNNRETEHLYEFYVDKTPPTIIQEISGKSFAANGREYSSGRSQLKISTIDNKAGVKEIFYSINNGPYVRYEKPVTLANTSGTLSVKSYATDQVGNIAYYNDREDQSRAGRISYVDLSGPAINHSFAGPLFSYNNSVIINSKTRILLKATDKESGFNHFEYSIDNRETNSYTSGISLNQEGTFTVAYIGYDNVDNTAQDKFAVLVDNTGPEIFYRFSAPSLVSGVETYPIHASLFVSATDKLTGFSHMTYTLDGKPAAPFTGYIAGFTKGNHKLVVKAYDKLGNESEKVIGFEVR